ncbi:MULTISPECIES: ABC transporter ATP-binding protein [Methylomonas]|uniref:Polysaccharide/polyol phosphate ABC transporter ATP-binding protein n=2 Tax=Methylomonas TaxID=416 RepID=A0A126T8L6_9GAMM|nr:MULTISPECIES: ABC transporter ATP-binding protein [Methylomonas]AMK78378.1 polysaccharide/polyol phosphate ABC transporter ATP-binding protein [Methylomonas denitrificans]OAI04085.1 polysaccharide/polyol phosphate ABC transporter ATP-binding protein [Methylomonas methanica]TCV87592.1 ABC-type polysaccharide/polyol phosphate transport system ATPase subunit [Methylomonas methanica]
MAIIEVNHLTKEYQLGHLTSLKETALNALRRVTFQPVHERELFKALDDVNFHIDEGEVVGIIGHNGAGKSTLLKHLANISTPTKGKVIVRGSVAPLIEVGAGVNPELTGRENIYLNGAILGIPKKVIQQKLDEIIDFSELEQFIDTPVKRYSSGMTVKLGFSIATSMEADILIVDEVLAVGDLAFQRKCFDRMEYMIKRQGKTVLIVSHNIRQIERLCNRVLLLNNGKISIDSDSKTACDEFYRQNDNRILENITNSSRAQKTDEIDLLEFKFYNEKGEETEKIEYLSSPSINFKVAVHKKIELPVFIIGIHTTDLLYIATQKSDIEIKNQPLLPGIYQYRCQLLNLQLLPGPYCLRFSVDRGQFTTNIYYGENLLRFNVLSKEISNSDSSAEGFFSINTKWEQI